jgi:hypothetical protein
MRSVRTVIGLAAAVCAFGTLAAPALAAKPKPPLVFGKFVADYPDGTPISPASTATAKGHGELSTLDLAAGALRIEDCEDVKSTGQVSSESSETFFQNITFAGCYAKVGVNKEFTEELKLPKFTLGLEFRSNGSAEAGAGSITETEVVNPSTVVIPVGGKKAPCDVTIPRQVLPSKDVTKPEAEYEFASYGTDTEEANPKKFPLGYQEELEIGMEFIKMESWVKPSEHCIYEPKHEGEYDNTPGTPAYGYTVYKKGTMEADLEEIKIKDGNLGFEPAPEA